MKIITAIPLNEVNGIKFGMKRSEVRKILGKAREFKKSKYSKTTTDDFGYCHVFYNINDECEAIELFDECEVKIKDQIVFPNKIDVLKSMITDIENDGSCFISKKQSIGVYAPDGKTDSILFGCKEYYEKI